MVNNPAFNKIIYAGPSFITDPTAPQGSRANPFPTIGGAIGAAGVGDFVAVLPGVYTENVNLKSLVRVYSAAPSSTDAGFQPGNALQTVIRAPFTGIGSVTVAADVHQLAAVVLIHRQGRDPGIRAPLTVAEEDSARGPIVW